MRSTPRADTTTRDRIEAADGLSLVEMLVAILLLGVILTAAASSLVQFMRTAADNERRVQATALMNSLHEEFQALAWQDAVVYEDELQALVDDGFDGITNGPQWEFDGLELVTLPGPVAGDRRDGVPEISITPETSDGRDYEVIRLVAWSDRDAGIKRFITIVQWSLYNRVYQERYFSERAPTASEAGDPERPRVVQFQVGPSPMQLIDVSTIEPAQNEGEIRVTVRFSSGVDTAVVRYRSVDTMPDESLVMGERTLDLTAYITDESGRGVAWRGTIPAGTRTFPNGTRPFRAIGTLGGDEFTGSTAMDFEGGSIAAGTVEDDDNDGAAPPPIDDGDGGDPYPDLGAVTIESAGLNREWVCLDNNGRFVNDVTVTAFVSGVMPDAYNVSATYTAGGTRNQSLQPVTEIFNGSNAEFKLVLAAGSDHGFSLTGQNTAQTDFVVTALRPGSGSNDVKSTGTLTVLRHNQPGC